jgi:integrase
MLSFFMDGVRIEDLITLKKKNVVAGKVIQYVMRKGATGGTVVTIAINAEIQNILDLFITKETKDNDYIFPFLKEDVDKLVYKSEEYVARIGSATSLVNKYLKKIADDAAISAKVTTHIARHTFAGVAEDSTTDIRAIQEALKHTDIKITEGYLKSLTKVRSSKLRDDVISSLRKVEAAG